MSYYAKPCTWNGVPYDSQYQAAAKLGITRQAMTYRINQGYTCDDDMKWNASTPEPSTQVAEVPDTVEQADAA